MDLASRATRGNASIEAGEFFAQHKLNATRLSDLATLRLASCKVLQRRLSILGYNAAADVRKDRITSIVAQWTADKPVLVIKGESGQGKSWLLFGIALELAVMHRSVVLVNSRGDADADRRMASDIYCQEIKGNNDSISLNRLAASTKQSVRSLPAGWLSIGIDGVQSVVEARSLAMEDWEERRMKLVISCISEVTEAVPHAGNRHRYLVVDVGDFSGSELSAYLADRLGEDWPDIPVEMRGTLRRPLLARIYSDIAPRGPWRPTNEFALLDRYWARLREDVQADHPSDIVGLRRLALSLLAGKPFPWTEEQVHAQLADDSVSRLMRIGILRRTPDGRYIVWHDRVLSWAVAESLVSSVRSEESSVSDLCSRVLSISASPIGNGTSLTQVVTDVLWLLSEDEGNKDEIVTQMIKELEGLPWGLRDDLLSCSVAKVGPRLVPALGRRLEAVTDCGDGELPHQYLRGMTAIDAEETPREAMRLLNSTAHSCSEWEHAFL